MISNCTLFRRMAANNVLFALAVFFCVVLCTVLRADAAEGINAKDYFKKGKAALEDSRYAEAVSNLSVALKEFSVIGDYSLLYLSEAHHGLGDHDRSLDNIRSLILRYPDSALLKKAKATEIREATEMSSESLVSLYEAYVLHYPDDDEILFQFGSYLKRIGQPARAIAVFKKTYIQAGAFAKSAFNELNASDLTSADYIERASNLMARYDFREAEKEMHKALPLDDGNNRVAILKNLGYAMFMQKKYKEAAVIYAKIKDTYFLARSLYRAGDKDGFDAAMKELLSKNDIRVGNLLIAVAADKRRSNDFDEALRMYDAVLKGYPSEQEEAMWGKGWTYYISADYKRSSDVFSELYAKYENPKYLYWQAKSMETAGSDAGFLYNSLLKKENNYYSVLSHARLKAPILKPVEHAADPDIQNNRKMNFDRVDVLLSLGMKAEASAELAVMQRKVEDAAALLTITSKLHEIGDFKRSVGLVTKTVYSEKNHRLWYPLAYWEQIEHSANEYGLDPLTVLSIIREESRFDASAHSAAGARGLMQIMPATAYRIDKSIGIGIKTESDLNIPETNIRTGAFYLKMLFEEFRSLPVVLAAYNAGEAPLKRWQKKSYRTADEFIEDIPYSETRNYIKRIITSYFQYMRSIPNMKTGTGLDFLFRHPW